MGKGSLFELHIGVEVDLRRFSRFMAEPKSDHAEVHTPPQQRHGDAVSQGMWRDLFRPERRAGLPRDSDMTCNQSLYCIGAETPALGVGKDGVVCLCTLAR